MNKVLMKQKIQDIKLKYKLSKDIDKYINMLREIVALRDGKIKEGEKYINSTTKITFIDKLGNEFKMLPGDVMFGHWSSYEVGKVRNPSYHMKELEKIVLSKGGKIKEGEKYINSTTKITFIDNLGNEFKMIPSSIKMGKWSPYESNNVRDSEYHMKALEKIVLSKGGKIKEGEKYINSTTKMTFVDKLGNEFKMIPKAVKNGQWSPYLVGKVYDVEHHMKELEKIVLSKGGKIKDGEKYISSTTKMTFVDKLGNEFKMIPSSIKMGKWSPYESNNVRDSEYHMKALEKIVLSKGGKIKEGEKYINNRHKITFIDQLGNEFKMTSKDVKNGQWSSLEKNCFEHVCRQIIENIYNYKFPSIWGLVKRKNGNYLQLDGYSKELNIAFEYQGIQHKTGWKNDLESLIAITQRDNEKKEECKNKNILLLEINYYKSIKNIYEVIEQTIIDIKKSYKINNKKIPVFIHNLKPEELKVDLSKISHIILMQKELEKIVLAKGGKIKDGEIYIHSKTKMRFIDKLGNEFESTPNQVKRGFWSPYESNNVRNPEYHMKKIQEIAFINGGKIKEGEKYINSKTKMAFIDYLGNEFKRYPNYIKNGKWPKKHIF